MLDFSCQFRFLKGNKQNTAIDKSCFHFAYIYEYQNLLFVS